MALLEVDSLSVSFGRTPARVRVVEDVSFALERGEVLGLVGESGCGKTVTALSAIRLLPSPPSHLESGSVSFDGRDLTRMDGRELRALWGNRIGVVFQNPMSSLNPTFTVGQQLREALRLHVASGAREIEERVLAMLARVGVNAPQRRLQQYPFELSGGLRQRVMIAMALLCRPQLLIADEPTTALDVTLQAQILDLLRSLRAELGMAIVMITHDLGVVAQLCERVLVMYAGRIAESAPARDLFRHPRHPYTHGLLASIPRLSTARRRLPAIEGMVAAPGQRPAGCAFAPRCVRAQPRCAAERPPLAGVNGHRFACWNPVPA